MSSDIIRLLPDSVANQIAAGEVIQRPASVIKELVENAVDAGATDIQIYIKDGGRTLIHVIDNGKGMSETDARMAFERHATSKITQASDLFSLHTMGFRGEALPSICAISQVELRTRPSDAALGTRIVINGSQLETQEPCVCDAGSNFMVKNIFFNAPARRKFMKGDNVELGHIMREFERLALVNNEVRMLIDTGSRKVDLRPGSFRQRISDIWKNNLNNQLIKINVETAMVKIHGYMTRPEFARRRNALQFLIVNDRNMRHPYFSKAILQCYEPLIATGTQPCYFIKFSVDPATIDVNVHPTKSEIKFENEHEIRGLLIAAVKQALGSSSAVPSIDFESDILEVVPPKRGDFVNAPARDFTPVGYNPFNSQDSVKSAGSYNTNRSSAKDWEQLYADFMYQSRQGSAEQTQKTASTMNMLPGLEKDDEHQCEVAPICLQFDKKYIVTSSDRTIIVIDQHRAHVKILYEQILKAAMHEDSVMQGVMFAETIHLDTLQQEAYAGIGEELKKVGFQLEYLEQDEWQITGVPSVMRQENAAEVVMRIIDSICENEDSGELESMLHRLCLAAARSMAIEGGTVLSTAEMEHLISELFRLPEPKYTPNGNLIIYELSLPQLRAIFR